MIKRIGTLGSLLLTMLASAGSAAAQTPGTFEIGGFARYSLFDDDLTLEDKVGGGGMLGIFIIKNLALEAEGAYTKTGPENVDNVDVTNTPIRGRLTYHIPIGGPISAIRVGAGYVRDMYGEDADFDGDGVTGVLGVRIGLSSKLALNIDGTVDYVPSPPDEAGAGLDNYMNFGVQGGLALVLGNKYDDDKDGVKDNVDRCKGTPAGESVNGEGCSASQRDTDKDGVNDSADRCANTAAGEKVNAEGCAPSQLDNDHDGLIDNIDKCPATPAGEAVDQQGCSASQRDDDGDGVKENVDKCPDTPAGEQVDEAGCSANQRDTDGDKVPDASDQCPDTPAGDTVDSRGCSRDTDADGISDGRDQCPSTPNGQAVDETGCPKLFEGTTRSVILQGVNFTTGKATLTDASKAILVDVAHSLAANPGVRVQVSGHTDNTGSRSTNMRLSAKRADAVEQFLVQNGVSPAQLTSKGFGPDKPVATNKTAAGRSQNRRVELNRID
jgi:outer membrane protein OmpA-like peptidoglycan-associated protein